MIVLFYIVVLVVVNFHYNEFGIDQSPCFAFQLYANRVTVCDINPSAIKTGMLPNSESVRAVAESIRNLQINVPIVVDPVLVSTSGENLADSDVASTLLDDLFPIATVVTPNIPEASALLGRFFYKFDMIRMYTLTIYFLLINVFLSVVFYKIGRKSRNN